MKDIGSSNFYFVGIYVRESRDDNGENYETIETQRDLLIDFVKKEQLGKLQRIYIDDNVSGSGFERKGIELLKSDVISNKINLLVLKDLSRLGRNNARTLLFLDFLEEYGVRVMTFDRKYDSLKDNDTVGIETWFNERYIRDISKKIRTNLRYKIEKGEYIGRPPYGYKKSANEKNRLCIDSSTAHIVKEIFKLYRGGYGYQYISNHLNEKKIPPPSARCISSNNQSKWNAVAIQRILCNRVYIGDTVQGVSEKISFKSKKTRRLPLNRWVITTNTHDAIISREEFEEIQRIRVGKIQNSTRHKGEIHLLSGLMYCGKCGSVMFARTRKGRPMGYICGNYAKNGKASCTSHYVCEKYVTDILLNEILELFKSKEIMDKAVRLIETHLPNKKDEKEIDKLEQLLFSKQRQQDILYLDKLEGKISGQLFERMNSNIENRIIMLEKEIKYKKKEKNEVLDIKDLVDQTIKNLWENAVSYEIVRLIVERIIVYDSSNEEMDSLKEKEPSVKSSGSDISEGAIIIDFKI